MFDYAAKRFRSDRSGLRRIGALTAAAAAVAALAACHPGSAASGSGGGASFFKGKTITLIAPDKPGGSYDSYARLFAPYVARELGATVNVENIGGAGTLQGSNQMAASKPDGLTIGMVNVGADIATKVENQPGEGFDMRTISWIGQPAQIPNALVTQPDSNIRSFGALLHPAGPVNVLDIRNGIGDTLNRVIYGAFRVPYRLDTGFEATSELKQGFLARDGQTILEAMSTLYPLISGNDAKPLLLIGSATLPSYARALAGVPTLQSEMSRVPLSAGQAAAVTEALALSNLSDDFAAPPGLPAADLAALRQAFAKAAALPALRARARTESLPLAWISGSAVSGQVASALSDSPAIAPYVK